MSIFRSVAVATGGATFGGRISGPLPRTKTRKLFTPGVAVRGAWTESANPSATGITPVRDEFVKSGEEQRSKMPARSAKLMIIEGVGPSAAGLVNGPSVIPPPLPAERASAA